MFRKNTTNIDKISTIKYTIFVSDHNSQPLNSMLGTVLFFGIGRARLLFWVTYSVIFGYCITDVGFG